MEGFNALPGEVSWAILRIVVTMNHEKSAEVIVGKMYRRTEQYLTKYRMEVMNQRKTENE